MQQLQYSAPAMFEMPKFNLNLPKTSFDNNDTNNEPGLNAFKSFSMTRYGNENQNRLGNARTNASTVGPNDNADNYFPSNFNVNQDFQEFNDTLKQPNFLLDLVQETSETSYEHFAGQIKDCNFDYNDLMENSKQ